MAFGSSLSGIRGFMAESLVSRHVIPTVGLCAKAGIYACGKEEKINDKLTSNYTVINVEKEKETLISVNCPYN